MTNLANTPTHFDLVTKDLVARMTKVLATDLPISIPTLYESARWATAELLLNGPMTDTELRELYQDCAARPTPSSMRSRRHGVAGALLPFKKCAAPTVATSRPRPKP